MTKEISKVYNDITYTLDDDEDVEERGESANNGQRKKEKRRVEGGEERKSSVSIIQPTRLREVNIMEKNFDDRREH